MGCLGSKDPECGVMEGKRRERCKEGQVLAGQIRRNQKLHWGVKKNYPGRAPSASSSINLFLMSGDNSKLTLEHQREPGLWVCDVALFL